jgi:hypothetical protein
MPPSKNLVPGQSDFISEYPHAEYLPEFLRRIAGLLLEKAVACKAWGLPKSA